MIMIDPQLKSVLERAGFDDKEARVYLALLGAGKGTASEVAVRAGLKRAIVYHVIDRLRRRGYAQEFGDGKVRRFGAADPLKVFQNIETAATDFRLLLPMMRAIQNTGAAKPRIEFFEGREAIVSVYRQYERGNKALFITSTKRLNEFIPDETDAWLTRYESGAAKYQVKNLLSDTPADRAWGRRAQAAGQAVRYLPKGTEMEMDFAIVDDTLGITSFDPLFIVVIYSAKIAHSARQLFEFAWREGKK